ncbi:Hematological and neurological expressed 1-like protein [Acipenser ruthenus]|uniref:Hematological and neurological expressed 1-like protein n=1 Tax=Acipenser ruthenus TaxID=7906 RepID=A0A444V7N1_ACIRT|nr:Hematological and neurological expressed 1-like protein [Acipenser ruthenus]
MVRHVEMVANTSAGNVVADGGKDSEIFGGAQPSQPLQHPQPLGSKTSNIFGDSVSSSIAPIHPNKPKVGTSSKTHACTLTCRVECVVQRSEQKTQEPAPQPSVDEHEPRLGPRPRAHNKVIQPPGGKSSVVFY